MMKKVNPIPEHYHTITPTLIISDVDRAVELYGKVRDRFGHEWALSKRISNLTPEEIFRNYAEMVAKK